MTTVYVDPGAAGTGSGADYTNAYTSLNSAIVNEAADLTAGAGTITINCRGSTADTTVCAIAGFTTDASNYVNIVGDPNEATGRHDGKYNTGTYRIEITSNPEPISVEDAHVRITGIQTYAISPNTTDEDVGIRVEGEGGTDTLYISGCIIRGGGGNNHNGHGGIFCRNAANLTGTGSFLYAYNNVIYDFNRGSTSTTNGAGIWMSEINENFVLYNNTVVNCMVGIRADASATVLAKNNLSTNSNGANSAYSGTFTTGSDYNVSDDTSSVGTGSNNVTSGSITYVDAANDDYHLDSASTDAKDDGTDLSADSTLAFSVDIDLATRPATVWDCGADETASAGGTVNSKTVTDTLAATDDSLELRLRDRENLDTITATDATAIDRLRNRIITDTLEAIDAIVAHAVKPRTILDTLEATDSIIMLRQRQRVLLDTLEVIDSIIAVSSGTKTRTVLDTLEVIDANIPLRTLQRVIADSIEVTDATLEQRFAVRSLLDTIELVDFSISLRTRVRQLLDDLTATDSTLQLRQSYRVLLDTITAIDSITATYVTPGAGTIYSKTVTDTIAVDDFNNMLRQRIRLLQDAMALIDGLAVEAVRIRLLQDTITGIVDSLSVSRVRLQQALDTLAVTDNSSQLIERKRTLTDAIELVDFAIELRQNLRLIADNAEIADTIVALYITEVLNPVITAGISIEDIKIGLEKIHILTDLDLTDIDLGTKNESGQIS